MQLVLRILCWVYLIFLIVAITGNVWVALNTEYGVRIAGCYHYDAMLVGVACEGFEGADVLEGFLVWPFFLIYAPIMTTYSPLFLLIAVSVWFPPAYLLFCYVRQWRRNRLVNHGDHDKTSPPLDPSF